MSLSLVFLLSGGALVADSSVILHAEAPVGIRSVSAAALAAGGLMLLVGLVNALSGTM